MITYDSLDMDVKTVYSVEYIPDEATAEQVNIACERSGDKEPWEYYTARKFDDPEEAINWFTIMSARDGVEGIAADTVYDVRLIEEIIINGQTVRETFTQLSDITKYWLRVSVDKDTSDALSKAYRHLNDLEKTAEQLQKENKQKDAEIDTLKRIIQEMKHESAA